MTPTPVPARFTPSPRLMRNLLVLTVAGMAASAAGIVIEPDRAWSNVLLGAFYLLGLGTGAAVFIALLSVSNAGWGAAIIRVPEAMLKTLPAAAVAMLAVMLGIHSVYSWSRPEVVAASHVIQAKSAWLNVPFFVGRTVLYLALWLLFAQAILKLSRKQDESGDERTISRRKTASAIFLAGFGVTFTLASMDWIMSIEPAWYSTIFGIYNFSGMFLNGLAALTLVVVLLKRMGPFANVVSDLHLHNLGKLIFAFSTFWMYIWFSQYLLIWYANIPEEAGYFVHRQHGSWLVFTIVNVLFNWAIPFVILLPAWTKKREGILLRVCIILMIGHWVDLFWMILPPVTPAAPAISLWEVGPIVSMVCGFFYLTFRGMSQRPLLPARDPYLVESLSHHAEHV